MGQWAWNKNYLILSYELDTKNNRRLQLSHSKDENTKSLCTILCTISLFIHWIRFMKLYIFRRMTHWQLGTFVYANISLALQYLGIPRTILSEATLKPVHCSRAWAEPPARGPDPAHEGLLSGPPLCSAITLQSGPRNPSQKMPVSWAKLCVAWMCALTASILASVANRDANYVDR